MLLDTLREIKGRLVETRRLYFPFLLKIVFVVLWLAAPAWLHAETISGTVEDQTGAVIVGARRAVCTFLFC